MNEENENELCERRSRLKQQGRFKEAIPFQLQILEIAIEKGRIKDISNAWNYLSVLYSETGQLTEAEFAAWQALDTYANESAPSDETIACYQMVLAGILADQGRFVEAVSMGNSAEEHYSVFHTPPDDFLNSMREKVEAMIKLRDRA